MKKSITVIPARKQIHSNISVNVQAKRRVAAYARVSTDSEEQLTSYEAQVDYYTRYIKNRADWEFVNIYTDEGISATNTKHREGFNQMIKDALDGKIDLILTKSVSRFSRNTVDGLTAVRKLKDSGVEVYFEKENIYTFDGKGELLITIMSSLAQEESRSISENVTWGCRKRFADGKVMMSYGNFLGYEKGEDGQPKIVEKEAKVVRLIYRMFLEGKTPTYIAKHLTEERIPTPRGKAKWYPSTVESILKNEKYKGSALLQKTFTTDFLTKKKKVNEGEIPQYYVEDSHPAIVSKEVYDLVQMKFEKRKRSKNYKTTASCFSGMIICGDCGSIYGSKVWHSNTKYRRIIWQCNNKFKNEKKCTTPHLTEDIIKSAFVNVFNELIENKDEVISFIAETVKKLSDTTILDEKIALARASLENKMKAVGEYVELNKRMVIPQEEYNRRFNELINEYDKENNVVNLFEQQRAELIDKSKKNLAFLKRLKTSKALQDFDENVFCGTVDRIIVFLDRLIFVFKDEMEVEYKL